MAFLITTCHNCEEDSAIFDDGSYIQCKCGSTPNLKPVNQQFKRPQLIEDEANEQS